MNAKEWNEGLNNIDPSLLEEYLKQKEKAKKTPGSALRILAVAAAAALLIAGAVFISPLLHRGSSGQETDTRNSDTLPYSPSLPVAPLGLPGGAVMATGEKTFGTELGGSSGMAEIAAPGFRIRTVAEAEVTEIFPDEFTVPGQYSQNGVKYNIARLKITRRIVGNGLPDEIYLRFPSSYSRAFDGYDCFIFSLRQVGIENFLMTDTGKQEAAYFPNMFECWGGLKYGAVIAFREGRIAEDFWQRKGPVSWDMNILLDDPERRHIPAGHGTTPDEAAENILRLYSDGDSEYVFRGITDYVTAEDIFTTDEAKKIKERFEPGSGFCYSHTLYIYSSQRPAVTYARVINGIPTEERIILGGERGDVVFYGSQYSDEDLSSLPDIGSVITSLDLTSLTPPHIDPSLTGGQRFIRANGFYRKSADGVIPVIRIVWKFYREDCYYADDLYYVFDATGKARTVDRDELRGLIGDDPSAPVIEDFPYNDPLSYPMY
ncbi:MAG: hypothetical protein J6V01_01770 [Clostridia bacterium]|nr:hypothetical protein [Clostridia bacterium]